MEEVMKDYIGDSVYVEYDGYDLKIYTDNGLGHENTIVLEPEVYAALLRFVARVRAKAENE